MEGYDKKMRYFLIQVIRVYRLLISPLSVPTCRYTPTCSAYAIEALEIHGPIKGTLLSLKRIARCHPFGSSGYDPVPGTTGSSQTTLEENHTTQCHCTKKG